VHPGTLRVSIGIEDVHDLIDDLAQALSVASDVPVAVLA
jgi:O-acetylhomoserine (thiol)-lyase